MRITIRGRIFPKGGDDVEHPTIIHMYTTTTPHAPRGHTMRPRLYAIGRKVNLLLSEPSLSTCEKWLLPQIYVLCMTRNQEGGHGQDGKDTKYKDQTEKLPEIYSNRTTGLDRTSDAWKPPNIWPPPDDRHLKSQPTQVLVNASYSERTSVHDRTTGRLQTSGTTSTERKLWKSEPYQTSGPP